MPRLEESGGQVDTAGGAYEMLAAYDVGAGANAHAGRDAAHGVRIAGVADAVYEAVLDADVGLVYAAHGVHDHHVGDDRVECHVVAHIAHLAHCVTQRLTYTK